tara:strand:- start:518 stop:865 length:348 start_codon:yes stop_codon:yes gene_type:complete
MNKFIYLILISLFFNSCSTPKGLYSWSKYEKATFDYLKNEDEKSIDRVMKEYRKIISDQKKGTRGITPPGVHADFGFFLLQKGKMKEAKENLNKEIILYPESKIFIDRILKMIEE